LALLAALQGVSIAMLLGVPIGLLAGARGGWIDRIVMWFNNLFLSLPTIVAFAFSACWGRGLPMQCWQWAGADHSLCCINLWRHPGRREELYVEAANVVGVKP
jgi:ABC-type dipeptide/oligopeptide/nickel transport system permease subunit